MKKFADTILREAVASAMRHNKVPEELSVVDVHKSILNLPRCDFLRNSYLGFKEDTMGSYTTAAVAGNDSKDVKANADSTESGPSFSIKTEPMETDESNVIEFSAQGMSGSAAFNQNLKMEMMDESSNETRSVTRSGERSERAKSLSRTSSLASMTDFETLVPGFEIPPLMQDD